MNYCSQCGSSIPKGQSICSMCMGDMDHGSDGYYRQWAEEQDRKQEEINREREESDRQDYERECAEIVRNNF